MPVDRLARDAGPPRRRLGARACPRAFGTSGGAGLRGRDPALATCTAQVGPSECQAVVCRAGPVPAVIIRILGCGEGVAPWSWHMLTQRPPNLAPSAGLCAGLCADFCADFRAHAPPNPSCTPQLVRIGAQLSAAEDLRHYRVACKGLRGNPRL